MGQAEHFLHDSWSVLQGFIERHDTAKYWNRIGQPRGKVETMEQQTSLPEDEKWVLGLESSHPLTNIYHVYCEKMMLMLQSLTTSTVTKSPQCVNIFF